MAILPGVDNEGAEKQHFQHLDILRNLRQQYEVLKEAGVPPDKWMWQYRHLYSRFDMQGIPTHDNHGEPIDVSDRKEKEVELEEHTDAHTEYLEVLEENPDVLERLSYRIAEIQKLVVGSLALDHLKRPRAWATKDIYRGEQFQKDAMFSGAFARRETPRDM
ncbi:hypothetical protein T484DRAFT_1776035 [Baffinella frigidus]|nr:hypothetical protein T484DRAFT_1776035 [Cryptophyta sp. CCMP2293]